MNWAAMVAFSVGLLGWHYVGYPVFLRTIVAVRDCPESPMLSEEWPPISVIIIAHNEEDTIRERIENILSIDYPSGKIEIVVASDASTDKTVEIARNSNSGVRVVDQKKQNKSITRNKGVTIAEHNILLFTDADTRYRPNCIKNIVAHYKDPSVGGVCGRLVSDSFEDGAVGEGMGLYWKWEYYLRHLQGRLGLLVKYSGANMSMRRSFYREVPDDVDIDQMAGLDVISQDGKSVFEPQSIATERFPTSVDGELSTRRRLTVRALTALSHHRQVLNPFSNPSLAGHVWSYWTLRYCVPFLLVTVTIATALASLSSSISLYLLFLQLVGYLFGVIGYEFERRDIQFTPLSIPFSYLLANVGVLLGVLSYLSGKRVYSYSDQHEMGD